MGAEIKPVTADLIVKQEDNHLQLETWWDHNAPTAVTYVLDADLKLVPAGL
jgi:hypothetical protein